MSDRALRLGLRIFHSGGAETLSSEVLRTIRDKAFQVLSQRGDETTVVRHLLPPTYVTSIPNLTACGSGSCHHSYSRSSNEGCARCTEDPIDVTCKNCMKTIVYRQLMEPDFTPSVTPVIHFGEEQKNPYFKNPYFDNLFADDVFYKRACGGGVYLHKKVD